MPRYFEDYKIGENLTSMGRTMTEGEIAILEGIGRFSEPLMINKQFARATRFVRPIVPAPVIMFIAGGLEELGGVLDEETNMGISTQNNIKFKNPLRAEDTIHLEVEITGKKECSQPGVGLICHRQVLRNDIDEVVVEYEDSHLVKKKKV
jgi:acyl dehydratase